jgi:hypothetical protein
VAKRYTVLEPKLLKSSPLIQQYNQADPHARETYWAIIHIFPAGKMWQFGSAGSLSQRYIQKENTQ